MRLITWVRLMIIVLAGCGLGMIPLSAGAGVVPETSGIFLSKKFCDEIVVQPEVLGDPYCLGYPAEAAGIEVEFIITNLTTGEEQTVTILIGFSDPVIGGIARVTNLPLGPYQVCETVPAGSVAYHHEYGDPLVQDHCATIEVTAVERDLSFYNVPEDVDELPDTGAGLTAAPAPDTWVPVLVAGALLLTLAGSRLREPGQG